MSRDDAILVCKHIRIRKGRRFVAYSAIYIVGEPSKSDILKQIAATTYKTDLGEEMVAGYQICRDTEYGIRVINVFQNTVVANDPDLYPDIE